MRRPLLPLLLAVVLLGGCHQTRVNHVSYCGSHASATTSDANPLVMIPFLLVWVLLSLADG